MREIEVSQQKNLRDFDLRDITLNKYPYMIQLKTIALLILGREIL